MANQIQVKWESDMGTDYQASLDSLRSYRPIPDISVSMSIKAKNAVLPPERVLQIVDSFESIGAKVQVTLTATWGKGDGEKPDQLRLWPEPTLLEKGITASMSSVN